ncbi:fumarylacetoacetate hydrolase family protein [Saccharothrix sp. ALI-22-I]|uniref:fumarylacetoacetate hydrolase family protein n=1 Tax=Saccharothrix sp. ALI-22-I TaxID=1933778 RepID=UPI000A041EC0
MDDRADSREAGLGVVIGKRTHRIADPRDAAECIAGNVAVNDVSERSSSDTSATSSCRKRAT